MTAKDSIKQYILSNPYATNKEIAEHLDSTAQYVALTRVRLRKDGKIPKTEPNFRRKPHPALEEKCVEVGLPVENVSNYWYKGKHFSIHVNGKEVSLWDVKDQIVEEMKKHSPKYPTLKYPKVKDGHLLVIDPADMHIGKLCKAFETGDEYNHKIAIERIKAGTQGILQKVSAFPIDKVLLIIGNDMLHVDNAKSSTTGGTPQDTELMWYDAFNVAFKLQIELIEMLLTVAEVEVQYDPSNHDYLTGFFLAQSIAAWFRNCKGVTFNVSPSHRKYFKYGKNLIGTTHGDGAKETDLGYLMAHESKSWNDCPHRYFYTHPCTTKEAKII
jgi:hypothetical protein